jgi:ribosome recycling factor
MEENSSAYESQSRDEGSFKSVRVSRLSAERRKDILENLKREPEKRKETVRRFTFV